MLGEIFKALLITSLAGTCLTAVITVTKPITKKVFGYSWHYYIWLAVLAVMILPVRFTMPQKADVSPVTVQTVQTTQNVQTVQTAENAGNTIPTMQTEPKTDILQAGTSFVKSIIDNRLNILAYLWLTGAIILLLINLIGYIRLIIKMRKNSVVVSCPQIADFTRRKVTARVWENTSSPFMTGIFKPTLVLPARELTEEQLHNILRHEMTHFKRHDILYKWFVSLVKCLHWFNPVVWYVAKQINTECEISCDMAVTFAMNKEEEMSYIDTVLSLLPTGKTKQIPLTTQMASSKRVLKRRFEMIRNKRRTSKFVSALSAVVAVIMLCTTVFASGVLSDFATDDYTVEITNDGKKIELTNKPFIENGEVYVPLREIFDKLGFMDDERCYMDWDNGRIEFCIANKPSNIYPPEYENTEFVSVWAVEIGRNELIYNAFERPPLIETTQSFINAPVLKNNLTYIPYSYVKFLLHAASTKEWNVDYTVYDKNGDEISLEPFTDEEVAAARAVIEEYFRAGNAKDRQAQLATLTQWHHAPNVLLASDDKSFVTIKDIRYSPSDSLREAKDYVKYGMGSVNGAKPENVIVFYMDYDVSFPEGTSDQEKGAWLSSYNNWNMILIRDGKDGKWLIDDMGY